MEACLTVDSIGKQKQESETVRSAPQFIRVERRTLKAVAGSREKEQGLRGSSAKNIPRVAQQVAPTAPSLSRASTSKT